MKRVFSYLRVSGKGQIEGDGFARQRAAIEAFCAARGWVVVREFQERGISGTTDLDGREALTEMLSVMSSATADTFVVESSDRLARDLIVGELILDSVRKRGFTVLSAVGEVDLTNDTDPSRVLIRQILGVMAQYEKSMLVRKLRAARDRKSSAKGRRIEGAKPMEDKSELGREVGQTIFEMRERGCTYAEISAFLKRIKAPTPGGSPVWHRSVIHNIYVRHARRFSAFRPAKVSPAAVVDDIRHVLPEPTMSTLCKTQNQP